MTGQLVAYREQVRLGSRLAAAINCDGAYLDKLLPIAAQEGCKTEVIAIETGRVCLWVYKYEFLRPIIGNLDSEHSNSDFGIWATGKLFGYADSEIARYIEKRSDERIK